MTRYKYSRLIDALCICTFIGASASSCSEQEEIDVSPILSDTEIAFSLSEWAPIETSRAALFDKEEDKDVFLDKEKGGGNFTLYAYVVDDEGNVDENKAYMKGVRGWYFNNQDNPSSNKWMILDDKGQQRIYYWPNSKKLNFFAYMPDSKYNGSDGYVSKETHVKVRPDLYSKENGMKFECKLPAVAGVDKDGKEIEETQEFIYAYEARKSKQKEPQLLQFHHPFALINFKLKSGSYRMTINKFTFDKIYLNGTFSTEPVPSGKWECTGAPAQYTAEINKRVPNEVNYNSKLYRPGWFVVMPQDLSGVTLTLDAVRDGDAHPISGTFKFNNGEKWEAGKKYIYTISYGDNKEEIYFNVEVEPWTIGYEHNIGVE